MTVDRLDPLRLALGVSPGNLPVRRHLADALLERGRLDEAEEVYRAGLAMTPADRPLRLGLASTFFRQGKHDRPASGSRTPALHPVRQPGRAL